MFSHRNLKRKFYSSSEQIVPTDHLNENDLPTFYSWMLQFRLSYTPAGDLIRDLIGDFESLDPKLSHIEYVKHLESQGASEEAVATLNKCWSAFDAYLWMKGRRYYAK